MNQILDSEIGSNALVDIVEEYIKDKRDRRPNDTAALRSKLKRLGFSPDQIQDLLIEIDDDADKELLAGEGAKKARIKLIISLVIGVAGIVLGIASALGVFQIVSFSAIVIPFGIVGAAFIVAGKAYAEIGLVQKRKKRRFLKYQNWN